MSTPDNRCKVPFFGTVSFNVATNKLSPCCKLPGSVLEPNSILTKELIQLRIDVKNNVRNQQCIDSGCWGVDDAGGPSVRKRFNTEYTKEVDWENIGLYDPPNYVILAFSNKCQMMCVYCSEVASSMWELHNQKSNPIPIRINEENNRRDIIGLLSKSNGVIVSGGEPMLDENALTFLETLDVNPNRYLCVITNLSYGKTVFNKLLRLAERHPSIIINCSLDSIGTNSSRKYLNWDLWDANFKLLVEDLQQRRKLYPKTHIVVKITLGSFNYATVHDTIKYVLDFRKENKTGVTFHINPVSLTSRNSLSAVEIPDNTAITLPIEYQSLLTEAESFQIESANAIIRNAPYNHELAEATRLFNLEYENMQ